MIGRPKLSDGSTRAIQLKIGEGEFADVEEWRFANRIDSRSEAIRRLLQIGLRADARALGILEASRASLEAAKDLWLDVSDQLENGQNDGDRVSISFEQLRQALRLMFEAQEAAGGLVIDVMAFHQTAGGLQELEKAMAARTEYKQLVHERGDREQEE